MLAAFGLADGKKLWERPLGTIQKASPVLADGKLYVGTENGKFYVIKPDRGRARDPRRGPARHGSGAGGDHRVAGRGARPRVPRDDGRALRDRPEGSAEGRRGAAAPKPTAPGAPGEPAVRAGRPVRGGR